MVSMALLVFNQLKNRYLRPTMKFPQPQGEVVLERGKEAPVLRFHPWVFSGGVHRINGKPEEGSIVAVKNKAGHILGWGHYQEKGSISVRVFSFEKEAPTAAFWKKKLQDAIALRERLGLINGSTTNTCRLVFAEGDSLPGLIIDWYNGVAVVQTHSTGMQLLARPLAALLQELLGDALKAVYLKHKEEGAQGSLLVGKAECPVQVQEHGHQFWVDWQQGQKTGFFIDQRENRALLAQYAKGKKVLNTFCYTGGFSVYAAKAGAELVHSVDSSASAMELLEKNVQLNESAAHQGFTEDIFDFLKKADHYDIIVLDPPAFAKYKKARHNALMAYKRLNAMAVERLNPGGLLFTFSCSQVVTPDLFLNTVTAGAIEAGKQCRILHRLHQPADHPVSMHHPEGEYLKGLVLQLPSA